MFALDGGVWLHRYHLRGEPMAHLVSADRAQLLTIGRTLGLHPAWLQYKPLKDPRTGARPIAWATQPYTSTVFVSGPRPDVTRAFRLLDEMDRGPGHVLIEALVVELDTNELERFGTDLGNFIAWDASEGKIVWSNPEPFSVWSGALATAGDVVFYGTLEGYLKAVDAKTGQELYRFKTPSGIIGNVNTWMHNGKQYIGVLSGIGGWAGIGLAAGLLQEDVAAGWHGAVDQGRETAPDKVVDTAGLGAVGAYKALSDYTQLGGQLTVFTLP